MALSKIDVANMLTGATPVANGGTAATTLAAAGLQRPNAKAIAINGDMTISQRNTSKASITSSGYYTVDRIRLGISSLGTWTSTQESLTSGNAYINGFSNAFKIDCTTADGSPGASDSLTISQKFEGQDLQLLKKGTANAEKITVAFWIKATKTGTFIAELYDHDNTRSCSKAYTVSSSNTWEHKVVNFPADTTGALDDDNANSLTLFLWQGAGSNFTSGTLNTSWGSATNANRAVGQVNNADSTSNNVHITGIQLEIGEFSSTTLPPFQHESYADNLARCQRYFTMLVDGRPGSSNDNGVIGMGYCHTANVNYFTGGGLPVQMRTAALSAFTVTGSGNYKAFRDSGEDYFDSIAIYDQESNQSFSFNCTGSVSSSLGEPCQIRLATTIDFVGVDAEL